MSAWFLRLLFFALTLIASAFSTKILLLVDMTFSAGLLLLPFLLILMALLQLGHGIKFSMQTILLAAIANLVFTGYGTIITLMPSPDFAVNNILFDSILMQPLHLILNNFLCFSLIPLVFLLFIFGLQTLTYLKPLKIHHEHNFLVRSKYLSMIMVLYGVIILAANWYDPRFIKIFWFEVDSGTLVFPLTNIMLDIVTEVYGYKNARLAIWCGFLFNLIILLMGQIVAHWHGPDLINFQAYQHFLLFDMRIIIASFVSYFATEGISAYVLAKLKILLSGRLMALRFITSTMVGYLIDVVVFCVIAFVGLMSFKALLYIMLTSWLMMAGIELILLPLSVVIAKKLKQSEGIDIFDQNTRFSLLSLDHEYTKAQNKFHDTAKN